jgi:hypothetical protein
MAFIKELSAKGQTYFQAYYYVFISVNAAISHDKLIFEAMCALLVMGKQGARHDKIDRY